MGNLFEIIGKNESVPETERLLFHGGTELLLVRGGQGSLILDGEMIPLSRGSLVLIPPGTLHLTAALPQSAFSRSVLRFESAKLEVFSSAQTPLCRVFAETARTSFLTEDDTERLEALFENCGLKGEGFGADLRSELVFLELLISVWELIRQEPPSAANVSRERERLEPLIRRIREAPPSAVTLETVAGEFHYNKNYLCRVFRGATGISVGGYITAVRVTEAARCLRQGMSVKESGEKAGFRNNSNYISTFHRVTGLSPGQYRQAACAGKGDADGTF